MHKNHILNWILHYWHGHCQTKTCIFSTRRWLPHHHEWPLVHEGGYGLKMHWFGQLAGYPDWHIECSGARAVKLWPDVRSWTAFCTPNVGPTSASAKSFMLDAWAKAAGVNAICFGRIFKRETGRHPMEWLNERCLQQAARLLEQTSRTIQDIAEDCGFSSPFYSTSVFGKRFGKTPSAYRKPPQV